MSRKNLTVRVDESLKKSAEEACLFLGLTMTSVVHKALYSVIEEANKTMKACNEAHDNLSGAMTAKLYLNAAVREVQILTAMGYQPPLNISVLSKSRLSEYLVAVSTYMDASLLPSASSNQETEHAS